MTASIIAGSVRKGATEQAVIITAQAAASTIKGVCG
jgi:hypothetical protein